MASPQRGARRRWPEQVFIAVCLLALALPLGTLLYLLVDVAIDSVPRLTMDFFSGYPSRRATRAGVLPGLVGSAYLIVVTGALALPLGVGAAVYLEEYAPRNRWTWLLELNIANLAGVPSVIYGLLGLGVFVRTFALDRSLFAGACTLALLVMPIVITSSREALRTVPAHYREACYALGSTKWQCIRQVVLPTALPGIMTGAILSLARAIGETAPLIVVGAVTYVTFLPELFGESFTALPIQIFDWVRRPQEAFVHNAAAGIVLLLSVMLALNSLAIWLRDRMERS
ncbi:MAG: phosphate ABC transporter permease PstA [Myxococcales bacterium FL481]|nr:MAG: phosphate ABC transporter permease PstA [Myxococcales bacterium FL481]